MGKEEKGSKTEEETYPDLRFGPLDYAVSKLESYLSPEQVDLLKQFRESIPTIWTEELTGIEKLFLSDATLCRYLRAREWNLSKAQKMLVDSLKWRREYKPWAITNEDIDVELNNNGKMYISGFDVHDRPILIMKVRPVFLRRGREPVSVPPHWGLLRALKCHPPGTFQQAFFSEPIFDLRRSLQPRHDNTGDSLRDVKVKYLVYCLEKCIRAAYEQKHRSAGFMPRISPPGHFFHPLFPIGHDSLH